MLGQDVECQNYVRLTAQTGPVTLIALGSNLSSCAGGPEETLRAALGILGDSHLTVNAVSRFFRTPCFPADAGPDYVNAAACLTGAGTAGETLEFLHGIEASFDRKRDTRWGQRTLDLDLLAVADTVLPDAQCHAQWREMPLSQQRTLTPDQLILPHPRLQDRAFVLVPLSDIAPDWVHPILGQTVIEMRDNLPHDALAAVRPMVEGKDSAGLPCQGHI